LHFAPLSAVEELPHVLRDTISQTNGFILIQILGGFHNQEFGKGGSKF